MKRPGDLVFDPMAGAGTTLKMALLNDRRYLGMEVVENYCAIARERLRMAQVEHKRRLDNFFGVLEDHCPEDEPRRRVDDKLTEAHLN